MTCAPGGCVHDHDGGHDDDSQHDTSHGLGCCGGPAVNDNNPKPAQKA